MALPGAAALNGVADLGALRTLLHVTDEVWQAFVNQVGDPAHIGHLAALPSWVVAAACGNGVFADGTHAAQVGLLWRAARKKMYLTNGGAEADFLDTSPWTEPSTSATSGTTGATAAGATQQVKEHVLKMASLVDQGDESELLPQPQGTIQLWCQRYCTLMGSPPEEEEEPTDAQLSALYKRVITLDQAPYVDFSVWVPFGRRALKTQKFRTFVPLGDGSYLVKELPGPQNFQQWLTSWRVFKVAALSLAIVDLAALQLYEKAVEKLTLQWPQVWGLVALADDKGRAERLEKIRRSVKTSIAAGGAQPVGWTDAAPWSYCFKALAKDDTYWSEQVRHPATAWLAAGGRGAPLAPAEAIAAKHVAGGMDIMDPPKEIPMDEKTERRRQANRDKRQSRKRRLRDEKDELLTLRLSKDGGGKGGSGGKGAGKGKSKDKDGLELCFSWAQGKGPCADVPIGGECKCKVKRLHRCQYCFSPGHTNKDCPQK
eukprot:Skav211926  [mRNA]  locus=scaffold1086:167314:168771:+ [translate_table: standard]